MTEGVQMGNWKGGSYAILPKGGAFVTVEKYRTPQSELTHPKEIEHFKHGMDKYAYWGSDNDLPTRWRDKLEKSTIALSTVYRLAFTKYGQGLRWGHTEWTENGIKRTYEKSPVIWKWMRRNKYKQYLAKRIVDYQVFGNMFTEKILSKDKTQINRIGHKEAMFSRLEVQNEKSLRSEFIGYCSNWQFYNEPDVARLPLVDEYNAEDWIKYELRGYNFAHWSYLPSPGRIYYKFPYWGGLFRDKGWLDVANDIPELISAMHKNQVKLRYHIKIPYEYWEKAFPKWNEISPEQQKAKMDAKFKEMDDYLFGKEATGKSFTSHFRIDAMGNQVPGWEIVAIDDKFKQDAYIPNSQAADQQAVQTLGYDPSLVGLQGSTTSLGGNSGSDKRVSALNQWNLNTLEQEIILDDLYLISDFNGWELDFWFEQNVPARLDKEPTGSQAA